MAVVVAMANHSRGPRHQLRMKQMLFRWVVPLLSAESRVSELPGRGVDLLGACIRSGHEKDGMQSAVTALPGLFLHAPHWKAR